MAVVAQRKESWQKDMAKNGSRKRTGRKVWQKWLKEKRTGLVPVWKVDLVCLFPFNHSFCFLVSYGIWVAWVG